MTTQNEHHGLLSAIKGLYSKVALRALHARMNSNSKTFKSNHHQDISEKLTRHIEQLANLKVNDSDKDKTSYDSQRYIRDGGNHVAANKKNQRVDSVTYDELSKHFKTSNEHHSEQSFVGDKLKKSAWIHIHDALRLARQGDTKSAKLHADIANNALKEASHYMPVEEYKLFCDQVVDALSDLEH